MKKLLTVCFLLVLFSLSYSQVIYQAVKEGKIDREIKKPTLSAKVRGANVFSNKAVLYEQMDNLGTDVINSQNFEAADDDYDTYAADDFEVVGTWSITSVDVVGAYWNGAGPANSVNVWFCSDASGLPGANVYTALNVIPSAGLATGSFSIPLSTPAVLPAGHYWLVVQANMDFATGGQWGWNERSVQTDNPAAWQNPGGGFGTSCITFGYRLDDCGVGALPDQGFRINGELAPIGVTVDPESFDVVLGPSQTLNETLTISNNTGDAVHYEVDVTETTVKQNVTVTGPIDAKSAAEVVTNWNPLPPYKATEATILFEGFEGGVVPPAGWTAVVNNAYTWKIMTSGTPYSGNSADCEYDADYTGNQNEWLISPNINLTSYDDAALSFAWMGSYYWAVSPYDNYDLTVKITTNGGSSWTDLWNEDAEGVFTNWQWYLENIDITAYCGNNVKIAIVYTGYDGAQFGVDNITVEGTEGGGGGGGDWLTVTPLNGDIAAGNSANLNVHFDTEGLTVGETYTADITIKTGTPVKDVFIIPVTLTVGFDVSGHLLYYGNENPIANHEVQLEKKESPGKVTYTAITDDYGAFTFPGLVNGEYKLTVPCDDHPLPEGAMDWEDYQLLQYVIRYPQALPMLLDGLQLWAADLDGNGYINNADVNWMFRRLNQSVNYFPIPNWKFYEYTIIIDGNGLEGFKAYGISAGDINSSYSGGDVPLKESFANVEVPITYGIDQNYPNPFNPTTVINYQIPQNNMVEIAVYNMLGEKVITLVNEMKEAGFYNAQFDASNLSSGVYFYRITAGDFVQTMKMMLVR